MVKSETWVGTRGREKLYSHEWHKGAKEPTQGEDHRVGKANSNVGPVG